MLAVMCAGGAIRRFVFMRTPVVTLLLVMTAGALAACSSGGSDKAGGSHAPVVLHLAMSDGLGGVPMESPNFFAQEVGRLSHGSMRVDLKLLAAGSARPDTEQQVAKMVQRGDYELGAIGARGWDVLGVKSFEALQAPFLLTDQSSLYAVFQSDVPARMLEGLRSQHVVGFGLLPGALRHPVGHRGPLTRLADFRGTKIRVSPSRVSEAVMRALGAVPVHSSGDSIGAMINRHQIDAEELPFAIAPGRAWVTGNVTFFAKAVTLFANEAAFGRLTDDQRDVLRRAAASAARHIMHTQPPEAEQAVKYCNAGRVVSATDEDVAAMERATDAVAQRMRRDPEIGPMLKAIEDIKAHTAGDAPPVVPDECSRPLALLHGTERDPGFLDGTYRWQVTRAGAIKRGAGPDSNDIGAIGAITLRDGEWQLGPSSGPEADSGTFRVINRYLVFDWPRVASVLTFRFERLRDGTLLLDPVLPMDQGDQVVWSAEPWKRVGPPVRNIP
jgi:TRAP-type C4-dicarboxylate transport system substrate-binding protein